MSTTALAITKQAGAIIAPVAKTHALHPDDKKKTLCGKPLSYKSGSLGLPDKERKTVTLILATDGDKPTCKACSMEESMNYLRIHAEETAFNEKLVEVRKLQTGEIVRHIDKQWQGVCRKLVDLAPWIQVCFERIEAGENVGGFTSKKKFCKTVLNRTYGAVKFMLEGGNPANNRKKQLGDGSAATTTTTADCTSAIVVPAIPAPIGEWKVTEENSGSYRTKVWAHTDGREIVWEPANDEDGVQYPENFIIRDQWGKVGEAGTFDEAKGLTRPVSSAVDITALADQLAQEAIKAEPDMADVEGIAHQYLTARRIEVPEADTEVEQEKGSRRKPRYIVTLDIEASKLDTVTKKAKEAFGDALKGVDKVSRNFSRADDLDNAAESVEDAKEIVADLKGQMEEWRDNMPEGLQSTEKYGEIEECVSALESLESDLENISFDDIEFPGMY